MIQKKDLAPFFLGLAYLAATACNTNSETMQQDKVSQSGVSKKVSQDSTSYNYNIYPFQIGDNFVAMSPLPGKEDLEKDVKMLEEKNITAVVSLVSEKELEEKGLTIFFEVFETHGIEVYHSPIEDFGLPRETQMDSIIQFLQTQIDANQNVLVHCMGGYGRSGTVMGSYASAVLNVEDPIEYVRETRGQEAIETKAQEEFVRSYTN